MAINDEYRKWGCALCDLESVTRTSAGSRNVTEMRMLKEKSAISPQRVIHVRLFGRVLGVGGSNGARHLRKFRMNISFE